VPKPMRRTACLHVSRAMQAARRRADLISRAGSAGGSKPGRVRCYLELGGFVVETYDCLDCDDKKFTRTPPSIRAAPADHQG
jgi:hypothetical protein